MTVYNFYIGLDLGQAQDYTALTVIERKHFYYSLPREQYHVRHLERAKLGTPYPAIVEKVQNLMQSNKLLNQAALVVDATGVAGPWWTCFVKPACGQ